MKILFYISTIRGGGAAKVMSNLANQFCISNEIVFVTNFPGQHEYVLDGRIKRFNLEAEESRENILKKNFKRIICLRKYIKKETPDVVISFMGENNFRAIFANGFLRSKLIVSVRNDPDREYSNRLSRLMAKSLYRLADGCVFQTKDAMEWFPKSVQRKSRIILNQVDEKFFNAKREESPKGIITIGRLSKQKNHKMLISAYAGICSEVDDDLFIYGEGRLQTELEEYVRMLKISERVHFCGFTKTPEKVYEAAKCFVLSSDYEGMPNVLMEAMAVGVPCVSTDCPCGGPRMLIDNGVNGYLVLNDNVEQLAERLRDICRTDIADHISGEAKQSAAKFHPAAIFKQWVEFVDSKYITGE